MLVDSFRMMFSCALWRQGYVYTALNFMEQALAFPILAPNPHMQPPGGVVAQGQVHIWVPGHPAGAVQAEGAPEEVIPGWALAAMPAGVLLRYGNVGGLIWIIVKLPNGEEACFILFVQAVLSRGLCALHPQTTRQPGEANLTVGVELVTRKMCNKSWGGSKPAGTAAIFAAAQAAAAQRSVAQRQAYDNLVGPLTAYLQAFGSVENPVVVE